MCFSFFIFFRNQPAIVVYEHCFSIQLNYYQSTKTSTQSENFNILIKRQFFFFHDQKNKLLQYYNFFKVSANITTLVTFMAE
jgi:hypothetical protein